MSVDLWKELGLPLNLFFLINKKRESLMQNSQTPSNPVSTTQETKIKEKDEKREEFPQQTVNETKKNIIVEEEEINTNQPIDPTEEVFANCIEIIEQVNKKETYVQIFKSLHLIITNILKNPNDEKFRKVKADSPFVKNYVYPYKTCYNFFIWLSFQFCELEGKPYFIFTGDIANLGRIYDSYNDFLFSQGS